MRAIILACFLSVICSASANYSHRVQISYHERTNLLLTIVDDQTCYFTKVEHNERHVLKHHWMLVEASVLGYIAQGLHLTTRTLAHVRDEYTDLLADFQCVGKQIYDLNMDLCRLHVFDQSDDDDRRRDASLTHNFC